MSISRQPFGQTASGEPVESLTLVNEQGMEARIITFGATLSHLFVPNKQGQLADVVLGFDRLEKYLNYNHTRYFGTTVGRVAGRINKGRFELAGQSYQLATNHGEHHLHGGNVGLNRVVWQAELKETSDGPEATLTHVSEAGDEGYPGRLELRLRYSLSNDNTLRLDYHAKTDAPTPVNLTNHSYFNLAGTGSIYNHQVQIFADHVLEIDSGLIPTGNIIQVEGSALDLNQAAGLAERMQHAELATFDGFDHCYSLLAKEMFSGKKMFSGEGLKPAAVVCEPTSGRRLEVITNQPAIVFYTSNMLADTPGKQGTSYRKHSAFCLETQYYPDSPNHAHFPSIILQPDERYNHVTLYKFSAC